MRRKKGLEKHGGTRESCMLRLRSAANSEAERISEVEASQSRALPAEARAGRLHIVEEERTGCCAVGDPLSSPGGHGDMMQVRCPMCGGYHNVEDTTNGCPSCHTGGKKARVARLLLLLVLGITLGIVGGLIIGSLICRAVTGVWKDCGWWMILLEPSGPAAS